MSNHYRLAVIAGDGVGIEVTAEALKAIDAAAERFGFTIDRTEYDLGGDRYQRTGEVLPSAVQDELAEHDAIVLGAVGTPDVPPGILERGLLLKLRFDFDQYVNLRPVKLYAGVPTPIAGLTPDRCDMVILRENTEGLYAGSGGLFKAGTAQEIAIQESINTRLGVERILRHGYEVAQRRRRHLTVSHKTNVLNYAGEMWWRIAQELNADYPDVTLEYVHADAACLYLVNSPERFDVMVTDNLFGDIITDLGAMIQGGLGLAPGANINPEGTSMFEPIHGSAPKYRGMNKVNPIATIWAGAMLLEHLGEGAAAEDVIGAIETNVKRGKVRTYDMGGSATTSAVGDDIAAIVLEDI